MKNTAMKAKKTPRLPPIKSQNPYIMFCKGLAELKARVDSIVVYAGYIGVYHLLIAIEIITIDTVTSIIKFGIVFIADELESFPSQKQFLKIQTVSMKTIGFKKSNIIFLVENSWRLKNEFTNNVTSIASITISTNSNLSLSSEINPITITIQVSKKLNAINTEKVLNMNNNLNGLNVNIKNDDIKLSINIEYNALLVFIVFFYCFVIHGSFFN
ncbi:hypothetical protein BCU36_022985 [Vibrio lentus]|uniref:hypothetical protein n=1 Tax=Vibrio lentus TaxID=136468 RepID=UPI001055E590|nr:hypothetical protein [Vibrio lentus]